MRNKQNITVNQLIDKINNSKSKTEQMLINSIYNNVYNRIGYTKSYKDLMNIFSKINFLCDYKNSKLIIFDPQFDEDWTKFDAKQINGKMQFQLKLIRFLKDDLNRFFEENI